MKHMKDSEIRRDFSAKQLIYKSCAIHKGTQTIGITQRTRPV